MKPAHEKIHKTCVDLCNGYVLREAPIVIQLQLVQETKLYKELDKKNLFKYAVDICNLSESNAYSFISVGKKAKLHPCLQEAIRRRTLSISKACRIVSIITRENAVDLVEFAKTHTSKEIEREVRRRNPKAAMRARIKPLTGDTDVLQTTLPRETSEHITRAQTLLAQKTSKHQGIAETIAIVFKEYVERHDPLKKAERAQKRKDLENRSNANIKSRSVENSARADKHKIQYGTKRRVEPTAAEIYEVDLRDQRQCTHIALDGKRCCEDRWIDYHHIIRVADGGSNHPDNLTTLCSFHHDLVHQLVFPIEGEMSWLRSPTRPYGYQ